MPAESGRLEALLRHDRSVVLAGLAGVTVVAWAYVISVSRKNAMGVMEMVPGMAMPQMQSWEGPELFLLFVMWAVMMVAMMVPAAAPLLLMFVRAERQSAHNRVATSAALLLLGYLVVWWGFSAFASLVQWGLHTAALLSPAMVTTSSIFGGLLLLAAGVFQFSRLKRACLVRCRSPMSFLMSEWRSGRWGSFVLGVKHGAYCVGCCGVLMALLLVAGVMNVLWIAALCLFVLVERIAPYGERFSRIAGAVLILAGIALIIS